MKWTSWLALAALALLATVVVYSSLQVGGTRCEVCIRFAGREATEEEARRAAQANACALLASGVTDTMACERTPPSAATCRER
jgi:hypothetical protein